MRNLYLKVGTQPARGPLDPDAVEASLASGVVGDDAKIGPSADGPWESILVWRAERARVRATSSSKVLRGVAIGAVVLALAGFAIAGGLVYRAKRLPELCDGSARMVGSLEQHMAIKVFVSHELPKLAKFSDALVKLLRAYEKAGHGKIMLTVVDAKSPDAAEEAKLAGLKPLAVADIEEKGQTPLVGTAYLGISFAYGAEKDVIPLLAPDQPEGLEFWVTNKMREVVAKADGKRYRIGVVRGHGEIPLSEANLVPQNLGKPNLQQILTQNFPFYAFEDVDLGKGDVDGDLQGLVLTQPEADLTEPELRKLDTFVMKGRGLAMFVGAANVKASDASMTAHLSTHGLERLAEGYGMKLGKDIVYDASSSVNVRTTAGTLAYPALIVTKSNTLDTKFPAFFRLEQVAFPLSSSLTLDPAKQPGASVRAIARSSTGAVVADADGVSLANRTTPSGGSGQQILAAVAEGRLTSAFGSGKSAGTARVMLVASSAFLTNPFARAAMPTEMAGVMMPVGGDEQMAQLAGPYATDQLTSTILVFKNTVDWLAGDAEFATCALPVGETKK